MNKLFFSIKPVFPAAIILLFFAACNKELSQVKTTSSTTSTSTSSTSTSSTITVGVDSASGDSIYVIQPCARGYFRDSIAESALPSAVISYLDSNYSGFSFIKAFVIKDSAGTVDGYVAIVQYNGKPVAILFDSNGSIVQVLEQRQPGDMNGPGWHNGGRYGNRNGRQADTLAISSLPAAISAYYSSNYPGDTLIRAYKNIDSSYLVISVDNGVYASLFSSTGTFIKRVQLFVPSIPQPQVNAVAQDSVPSTALSFLSNTFPDYVFEKAFSVTVNNSIQGYIVILDANNTKYAALFDASGNLIEIRIIW